MGRARRTASTRGRDWIAAMTMLALLVVVSCGQGGGGTASPDRPGTDPGRTTAPSTAPPTTAATATSSALPETDAPTVPAEPACTAAGAVAAEPLRRRLAQLLFVTVQPTEADRAESVVADHGVGGVFVARGDGLDALLTSGRLNQLQDLDGVPPFVAVDDEGGRVQAGRAVDGSLPSAREMAATMSPEQVQERASQRGQALRGAGVTMVFAPVVDVSSQPADAVIGDRSFGSDPATVTTYARAYAEGLSQGGVVPVLKHFPGHGRAEGDSHLGVAVAPAVDDLREVDLVPYRQLLGSSPAVMVGHLVVPGLAEDVPTSLSRATIGGLLRGELGFDGLVVTDDLAGMRAVTDRFGVPESSERALSAGADLALGVTPDQVDEVVDRLEEAVADGQLPEAQVNRSVERVWRVKGHDPCAG